MGDAFCLKWNNHQTTLVSVFDKLFECESLVDCTLAAEGRQLKAHKVVLSACSPYLEELIKNHEDKHPIIIFNSIRYEELKAMLEYMYRGEVNVSQEQLESFLKVAESLKIKGLTDQGGDYRCSERDEDKTVKKKRRRASSESSQSDEKDQVKPEPKCEPTEETNSEAVEDLTVEEDDDEYGPPGPGTSQGSFSSQDFSSWQVGSDITNDEVFMAAQQEINSQQGNTTQGMPATLISQKFATEEEMAGQHYCLRWNNYQSNMTSVFHHLLRTQAFVDVTLACNDQSLKAHKVVLSACSSYFQKLLLENPCKHPTIIMPQDVCFTDLKFIIEFVYKGEIDVSQAQLQSVLKTADQLKIKGLCEVPEGKEGAEVTPLPPQRRTLSVRQRRLARRRLQYRQRLLRQEEEIVSHLTSAPIPSPTTPLQQQGSEMTTDDHLQYSSTVVPSISGNSRSDVGTSTDDQETKELVVVSDTALVMASPPHLVEQQVTSQVMTATVERETELNEPVAPSATLVAAIDLPQSAATHRDIAVDASDLGVGTDEDENVKVKFETLRAIDQTDHMDMDQHIPDRAVQTVSEEGMHTMMITPELLGLIPSSQTESSEVNGISKVTSNTGSNGGKSWRQEDMDAALEALRTGSMSLSRASVIYGIPSTTLWQRAHRQGIETPKKDGPLKTWTEDNLNVALDALRTGSISANKASKAYGIPSSTLYKIARREGIRLAAPFNAAPTSWAPEDLERALESIRSGQSTVQRAAAEFGIPSGTLYGRCKREGIELSRANPTPWSEAAMNQALDAVRIGQMSINQAAIHFNLPYSSLYGRFKRGKYDGNGGVDDASGGGSSSLDAGGAPVTEPTATTPTTTTDLLASQGQPQIMLVQYQQPIHMYQPS